MLRIGSILVALFFVLGIIHDAYEQAIERAYKNVRKQLAVVS